MHCARNHSLTMIALAAVGGYCSLAAGATLNVPGDYATIQAAIDASVNGDVVLIADGTYTGPGNRDIDFGGRLITVRSANGPANCTINAEGALWTGIGPNPNHRGFYFFSEETEQAVVDGLTITGGTVGGTNLPAALGGGIYCENSSPTLRNCIIAGNLVNNKLNGSGGGGICSTGGSPTILNCTFRNNSAGSTDGFAGGGGVFGGDLTIIDCTFVGNTAFGYGSAGGGALATGLLVNCLFSGNGAKDGGGMNGSGLVINCTFSENKILAPSIPTVAGGFSGNGVLVNCILWANGNEQIRVPSGTVTLNHCDIQGGWSGAGVNNINADPLFADPHGTDGIVGTPDDNLRLLPGSPCIDAGDNAAVPKDVTTDLDGSARFVDDPKTPDCAQAPGACGSPPVVDMGAFEVQPCPWDLDGNGAVGVKDFLALLAAWGTQPGDPPDFNGDGIVGVVDFLLLLAHWGPC